MKVLKIACFGIFSCYRNSQSLVVIRTVTYINESFYF